MLSGCGADEAERKRVELQTAIDEVVFEARPGKRLQLGISIGAAVFPHDGNTYETLLATADSRMYRDKTKRKRALVAQAGRRAGLVAPRAGTTRSAIPSSSAPRRACCSHSGSIQSGRRPPIPANRNATPVAPRTSPSPSVAGVSHGSSCISSHSGRRKQHSTKRDRCRPFQHKPQKRSAQALRYMRPSSMNLGAHLTRSDSSASRIQIDSSRRMLTLPIREAVAATPRAHIIRLDLQGQPFPYLAGQAAYLQPQGAEKRRPYSIASAPEETAQHGLIEFLVQTGPDGSSGLAPDMFGLARLSRSTGRWDRSRSPRTRASAGSSSSPAAPASRRCARCSGTRCSPSATARSALIYSVRSPEEFAYHGGVSAARRRRAHRVPSHGDARGDRRVDRPAGPHRREMPGRIDRAGRDAVLRLRTAGAGRRNPPAAEELGVSDDQIRIENWGRNRHMRGSSKSP